MKRPILPTKIRKIEGGLTYREVRDSLNSLPDDDKRLDANVTLVVLEAEECWPIVDFVDEPWTDFSDADAETVGIDGMKDVLDDDHMFFTITFE